MLFNLNYLNFIKYIIFLQFLYFNNLLGNEPDYQTNPEITTNLDKIAPTRLSKKYMIVSADKRASLAAKKILEKGGNAMDAVIAAQNILSVVEPQSSGLGGGGFLLYYNVNDKELSGWDGREIAPASSRENMFLDKEKKKLTFLRAVSSNFSVGVPGLYSMLADAHNKYGKISWDLLFQDSIELSNSFSVSPRLNKLLKWAPHIKENKNVKELYFIKDKVKNIGDLIANKKLNESLKLISKNPYSINKGKIAKKIAMKTNYVITENDLASWKTIKRDPICEKYKSFDICGFPPPTSGGIGVIQILKILDQLLKKGKFFDYYQKNHLFLEASRLAFLDRNKFVADPSFFNVPTNELIASSYINKRAKLINLYKANQDYTAGNPYGKKVKNLLTSVNKETNSTTHISIVDEEGNAAALTSSIEFAFGSGKLVNGFFLNNQLTDFSFETINKDGKFFANAVAPGKKPRSSMSPTFIFRDNKLIGIVGSPGGSRIICYVAKTIFEIIENNRSIEHVLTLPNICSRNKFSEVENINSADKLSEQLELYGQKIKRVEMTSGLNIIWKKNDYWIGSADPRREGFPVGK